MVKKIKIGKDVYEHWTSSHSKRNADIEAEKLRNRGEIARVKPAPKGSRYKYDVYSTA